MPFRAADPHKIPIDPYGNLTTKTEGTDNWTYSWNAENQLIKVEKNGVEQARFAYDPVGRRVEKVAGGVTSGYTYDAEDVVREVRGPKTLKYVHGEGVDEPLAMEDGTGQSFLHTDALGSLVKVTDAAGTLTLVRRYDVWGRLEAGASEPGYAFTGREWDPEIGLYYYRARYYDPQSARFLAEDPLGFRADANFYRYAGDRPSGSTDPYGLQECPNCSPSQTDAARQGQATVCRLALKSRCAATLAKYGLIDCFARLCTKPPTYACSRFSGREWGFPPVCAQAHPRNRRGYVTLYGGAFDPKPCDSPNLPAILAHEMSHVCMTARGQGKDDCDGNRQSCGEAKYEATRQRTEDIERNCSE